jgi:folate-binding protein YgfZ
MTLVEVASGVDAGLPWHFGDPLAEQRRLERGDGVVDLSNRDVLTLTGPDRARYLDLVSTGRCADLQTGQAASAYLLDPQGHITYDLHIVAAQDTLWLWTQPGRGAALAAWLEQRKFRLDVVATHRGDVAIVWLADPPAPLADAATPALSTPESPTGPWPVRRGPDSLGGAEWFVPRSELAAALSSASPAGTWAWEARRIAAGVPRIGVDTDERTIPNELGVPSAAVSLDKGCYPGQETVARVHNLGRPPRRLVRLHFDGSAETFVPPGAPLHLVTPTDAQSPAADPAEPAHGPAGHLGAMAYHWEDGPIGLALVRRDLPDDSRLAAGSVACSMEPLVAADAGLHFRSQQPFLKLKPGRRGLVR